MNYLTNAFSLNMLADSETSITVKKLTADEANEVAGNFHFVSIVGHADIASMMSQQLDTDVKANRQTVTVGKGDQLLVCQYRGPRLPEGVQTLPDGATLEWFRVEIE